MSPKRTTWPAPRLARSRHQVIGVFPAQIVAWQIVAALVAYAAVRRGWLLDAGAAVALLTLVLTVPRYRGRWLYRWLGVWWRYRLRRNGSPTGGADDDGDGHLAPLRELVPSLTAATAAGRHGDPIGVLHDGAGWVAVLAVRPVDEVLPAPTAGGLLPLATLAEVLMVDDIRLSSAQVVVHMVPAPGPMAHALPAIAGSYAELGAGAVPSTQVAWVALRLDPVTSRAAIDARGGGSTGAHRALRRCVARAVELLGIAGLPAHPLGQEQIRFVLALAAGTRPSTVDRRQVVESWHSVRFDNVTHRTYWLQEWPPNGSPARLLNLLGATPALFGTLSVVLAPDGRTRVLLRVSAPTAPATLVAGTALERLARRDGWRLVGLDGEHALGTLGTLPLGGAA
jgi:type VII secretion protein EccE